MADQELPNNDRDLQLARAIGQTRLDGRSLSVINAPLIQQLLPYRQALRQGYQRDQLDKEEVWNTIEAATRPSKSESSTPALFSSKSMRWAAAAVILIGVLFSFIYFQLGDGPELLAASESSIQRVQLADGSEVTLRPHSKLFAVEQSESSLLYKLQGEAWFEVDEQKNRSFSVQTAEGRVSVVGTRFMLSTWGNRTQIFLEKGSVKVQTAQDSQPTVLQPGESASIQKNTQIMLDTKATANEFTDWLDKQLVFEQKPVRLIADELEQQFNITIILPDNIAKNRLSGQLTLDNLQQSLDDLSLVLGGTFEAKGQRRYKFIVR